MGEWNKERRDKEDYYKMKETPKKKREREENNEKNTKRNRKIQT